MGSALSTEIANLQTQINNLQVHKVTYVAATVASVNSGASTFGANIPNPADGSQILLTGIGSPPQFLPSVGQTVTIALAGPVPIYQPTQVAPGTITPTHLSPNAPNAPTGLTLATATSVASDGTISGQITASWTAPVTTIGGSAIVGALTYRTRYRPTGSSGAYYGTTSVTLSALLTGNVAPGVPYDVQVAAVDQVGNVGAYTAVSSITVGSDTTPPNAPTAPTVSNYLGQLKITWDGNLASGLLPPDFDHVEVYVGTTSGFTPSSANIVADLTAAGTAYAATVYATTMWVKLIAVDSSGNKSGPSSPGSGATSQVVSADIFAGAVGTTQLANLAVTTAKINLLAVNDAQIGNCSVGKLTAGTISVDVVIGGRFTTALTGARVEMNSTGFQKFDSGGNKIVSITGTENFLHGEFMTGTSGRRIEILSAGSAGNVDFYSPGGIHSWVKSWTESFGPAFEAINMGMDVGGHVLYNRVNVDNIPQIRSDSAQVYNLFPANIGWFKVSNYNTSADWTVGLVDRLVIDGNGMRAFRANGSDLIYINEGVSHNPIGFRPAGVSNGFIEFWDNAAISSQSPHIVFGQPDNFGVTLKSVSAHLEVRDPLDTVFEPVWASAFTVSSDRAVKANIADVELDAIGLVKALRPRSYTRQPSIDLQGAAGPDLPVEMGLIAQEAPAEILGGVAADGTQTIDLYAYITLLAVALQQGMDVIDDVVARLAAHDAVAVVGMQDEANGTDDLTVTIHPPPTPAH